ncbi:hypothetical protein HDG37_000988 [Paraburkholderia sp. MM5384-R2]|nr:hypothetical protein [Paraburkholderia sp. MM5384-R2]
MSERTKAANLAVHSHRSHYGQTASGGAGGKIFPLCTMKSVGTRSSFVPIERCESREYCCVRILQMLRCGGQMLLNDPFESEMHDVQ